MLPYQIGQVPLLLIPVDVVPCQPTGLFKEASHMLPSEPGAPHPLDTAKPASQALLLSLHAAQVALCGTWYPPPLGCQYL